MFPGETIMSGANKGQFNKFGVSELKVMKSAAGFYLGTTKDVEEFPYSRETGYFPTQEEAEKAFKSWKEGIYTNIRS